jgi:hypothetical protein
MRSLDNSSAKAFPSFGTYSTDRVIPLTIPNRNRSFASLLIDNLLLPRSVLPIKYWASTYTTTNLLMHMCTKARRHRRNPESSRKVEESILSLQVKCILALRSGPFILWPPHAKSLASVAIHLNGGKLLGKPNLCPAMRRGNCCQNNNSLVASFERKTQQNSDHTMPIKAKKVLCVRLAHRTPSQPYHRNLWPNKTHE